MNRRGPPGRLRRALRVGKLHGAIELAAELDQEVVHCYAGPVRDCALLEHGADHRPEDPGRCDREERRGERRDRRRRQHRRLRRSNFDLEDPSAREHFGNSRVHVLPFSRPRPKAGTGKVHVRPARVRSEAVKDRDRADHAEPRDVVRELVELALNLLQHLADVGRCVLLLFRHGYSPRRVNVRVAAALRVPFLPSTTFRAEPPEELAGVSQRRPRSRERRRPSPREPRGTRTRAEDRDRSPRPRTASPRRARP